MRSRYPSLEPLRTGFLDVGSSHLLYWEESGNPEGIPVLFLHGGPGAGTDPKHRGFFDPSRYRIILFDQRGCGQSKPHGSLVENTTWHLVRDIEALRMLLQIPRWLVFGGSWGSTLALAYAETHPSRVLGLVLRGIFLGRKKEIDWFYQWGAHHIFADEWEKFQEVVPPEEQFDMVGAYYRRLTSESEAERKRASRAWSAWEGVNLRLNFDPTEFAQFTEDFHAEAIARIECHYFLHRCFFQTDDWLIEKIGPVRRIPSVIVQGRYDLVAPFESAWELHKAWPEAEFEVIRDAGHAASEPGITHALVEATDRLAQGSFTK